MATIGKHWALPDWQTVAARAGMYKGKGTNEWNEYKQWVYAKGYALIQPQLQSVTLGYNNELILPTSFAQPKAVTYFVATLGSEIDQKIAEYFHQGQDLKGFLLDAWSSQSVEQILRWWDRVLRRRYGKGTIRFSPGYKGLDITANGDILERFLQLPLVVANKQTGIMLPRKSCVALIGWEEVDEKNDKI